MFIQQDWLMRQIEMMAAAIAQLLLGKGSIEYDLREESGQKQSTELKNRLAELLKEGQLGKAEDLLFASLDEPDNNILTTAIDFYLQANAMSDEELEAQGFTRLELWEGLGEVVKRYGLYLPGFGDKP